MIAIVHSIYSQSVHAPALDAGLMDNDAERYCTYNLSHSDKCVLPLKLIYCCLAGEMEI